MGLAYTQPLTKVNKMNNSTRKDTELMIKLKKRIDKDTEALNILKQKYRDKSEGKEALFGSAWTCFIKVKAIQKVKPILNTNEARLIINLAFNQKWINKKTHSNCFKIPAVRKQEVSIWSK
tara:strand:- start:10 stop:372 length:363 start_codon:yes stop_codon:yes gene_type:complete